LQALLLLAFAIVVTGGVQAQNYPTRPIRIVVPASAGGAGDIVTRLITQELSPRLGQQILVDNRGGAGGNIGADLVAKALPDGYTILLCENGTMAINPALYRNLPFDPLRDFEPITLIAAFPFAVAVHPSLNVASLAEFIATARQASAPLHYATPGAGTPQHLGAEMFQRMAQIRLDHVPYRGGAPATLDLVNGQIRVGFIGLPPLLPHMRAGTLRVLAVSSAQRSSAAPDIPTVGEAGLPGFDAHVWLGFVAPARTPQAIIQRLNSELHAVLASAEIRRRLSEQSAEVVTSTVDEFRAFIRAEHAKWGDLVRSSGATAN
jgi:tripartite-type tricarboxylate transporter receptor subunit TctC